MNATISDDFEMLLAGGVWPGRFDARDLPTALRAVTAVLSRRGVGYALAGRIALGRYCEPQLTDLIALRLSREAEETTITSDLNTALASSVGIGSTVRLAVRRSQSFTEDRFIARAKAERWLDAEVRMATPEHLLWLAISSDTPDATADAERLLHSGGVDWNTIDEIVDPSDVVFGDRLAQAKRRAAKTAQSSYSVSVERRLDVLPQSAAQARRAGR